jgi:hypothetical protein
MTIRKFRVTAMLAGGQRTCEDTVEADAPDTAQHKFADYCERQGISWHTISAIPVEWIGR